MSHTDIALWIGIGLQLVIIVLLWWYAGSTASLQRQGAKQLEIFRQADIFNSLTRIHERFYSDDSREARSFLNHRLGHLGENVLKECLGPDFRQDISVEEILRSLMVGGIIAKQNLQTFTNKMQEQNRDLSARIPSLLDAWERVLADFDLIAIPVSMNNESVNTLAKQYKGILEYWAPRLLPFIAIEKILARNTDPTYRKPLLELLLKLGIDPDGDVTRILGVSPETQSS